MNATSLYLIISKSILFSSGSLLSGFGAAVDRMETL